MTAKRAILIVGGLTLFVVLFLLFDPPPSTSGEDPSGARVEDVRPRVVLRTEDDLDTELVDPLPLKVLGDRAVVLTGVGQVGEEDLPSAPAQHGLRRVQVGLDR